MVAPAHTLSGRVRFSVASLRFTLPGRFVKIKYVRCGVRSITSRARSNHSSGTSSCHKSDIEQGVNTVIGLRHVKGAFHDASLAWASRPNHSLAFATPLN